MSGGHNLIPASNSSNSLLISETTVINSNEEKPAGDTITAPGGVQMTKAQLRRRHLIGLGFAVCVVLIWVSSSVVIQVFILFIYLKMYN